jgi:hypothetical protein
LPSRRYRRRVRFFAALVVAAVLALSATAFANNGVHGDYVGHTTHGGNRMTFSYSNGKVHNFAMNGHVLVASMDVTRDHFDGYTKVGRLVYGAFRSDHHAIGHITGSDGYSIAYTWLLAPQ